MQNICNFQLEKTTPVKEVDGVLYEYRHSVTGARLLFLKTENQNKLFSVTFKTIPEDHTGVFHILEHSVFCGSEKYPVKDPFLEMEKGSVNTFLNAMTFPDRTVFPVSSRNEKDFRNLVSIYLDAVFRPCIYKNEAVFMQEGWHYEFDEEGISLNGVVFNEMKGVEASVDSRMQQTMMELLFPDTCYRFLAGGKPADIPKLSYEAYLAAHKKYYRPGNAVFYLEGALNLPEIVSMIEEYLACASTSETADFEAELQPGIAPRTLKITYPVMEDGPIEEQWFYEFGKILDDPDASEEEQLIKVSAGKILTDYLTGSMEAPLQQGILMNQLGQGVEMTVDTSLRQSYLSLKVRNSTAETLDDIIELLRSIPAMVNEDPYFKEQLSAIITNIEFSSHEKEEPVALEHLMAVLDGALHGKTAVGNLETEKLYRKLRELLDTDYYEKLLLELLDTDTLSLLIAEPSPDKAAEEKDRESTYINNIFSSMNDDERQLWEKKTESMMLWQQAPDSPEAKATIPTLTLSDIAAQPEKKEIIIDEYEGVKILLHPDLIDDMAYLQMYFPVPDKYQDSLCTLSLINNLFTSLPTEKYDTMMLYQKIQELTGELHFEILPAEDITWEEDSRESCRIYLVMKTSFLKKNTAAAMDLVEEVLYHTKFEDSEMIENILVQIMDMFHDEMIEDGSVMGLRKALSGWSAFGMANELLDGFTFMDHLKELLESYETASASFIQYVKDAVSDILTRDQMILCLTYPKKEQAADYGYQELISRIKIKETKNIYMKLSGNKEDSVIPIPGDTGFATAGLRLKHITAKKIAAWRVACQILCTDYLWQKIRVEGGAYGTEIQIGLAGDVSFYTYRDPDGRASLQNLKGCAEYLEVFCASDASPEPYIISAISRTDPLLGAKENGNYVFLDDLNMVNYEKRSLIHHEMLSLTKDGLREVATEMREIFDQLSTCLVMGN